MSENPYIDTASNKSVLSEDTSSMKDVFCSDHFFSGFDSDGNLNFLEKSHEGCQSSVFMNSMQAYPEITIIEIPDFVIPIVDDLDFLEFPSDKEPVYPKEQDDFSNEFNNLMYFPYPDGIQNDPSSPSFIGRNLLFIRSGITGFVSRVAFYSFDSSDRNLVKADEKHFVQGEKDAEEIIEKPFAQVKKAAGEAASLGRGGCLANLSSGLLDSNKDPLYRAKEFEAPERSKKANALSSLSLSALKRFSGFIFFYKLISLVVLSCLGFFCVFLILTITNRGKEVSALPFLKADPKPFRIRPENFQKAEFSGFRNPVYQAVSGVLKMQGKPVQKQLLITEESPMEFSALSDFNQNRNLNVGSPPCLMLSPYTIQSSFSVEKNCYIFSVPFRKVVEQYY